MKTEKKICSVGIWDETVPGIRFDERGVSNYAILQRKLDEAYPKGEKGKHLWDKLISTIREKGKGKRYDCIVGVSGGTDSSYLLHLIHQEGLRALAVNLDNGWSSDISVKNIRKITSALGFDLETYVINYEEVKDVLLSFMKASLPWIDTPTDLAIKAVLYKIAAREKIKFILSGQDFRTEGKQPLSWTYCDSRQFNFIQNTFGTLKLKSFPRMKFWKQAYYGYFKNIKLFKPYYYLDYNKNKAQQTLISKYGWEYYGGHHHENVFTRFAISYWLPKKFNIDKRIITLSAQVSSGEMSREDALIQINIPYDALDLENDKNYVLKKLGISNETFEELMLRPNKFYYNYPSSLPLIKKFIRLVGWLIKFVIPNKSITMLTLDENINEF